VKFASSQDGEEYDESFYGGQVLALQSVIQGYADGL